LRMAGHCSSVQRALGLQAKSSAGRLAASFVCERAKCRHCVITCSHLLARPPWPDASIQLRVAVSRADHRRPSLHTDLEHLPCGELHGCETVLEWPDAAGSLHHLEADYRFSRQTAVLVMSSWTVLHLLAARRCRIECCEQAAQWA
jgi:hypothetical protein